MDEAEAINRARLAAFTAAWAARDAEAAAACFTLDGIYAASVGPEPGATYAGRDAIRAGIVEMLAHDAGTRAVLDEPIFMGDRALVTWTYWRRLGRGLRAVRGCDAFTFSRGLIAKKDAFRKTEG